MTSSFSKLRHHRHLVRRQMNREQRNRISDVNKRAPLQPGNNLKSKYNSAIAHLLKPTDFTTIHHTLQYLGLYDVIDEIAIMTSYLIGKWAKLLNECCEKLIIDDSIAVVFRLIQISGRDYESGQMVLYSIQLLIILAEVRK